MASHLLRRVYTVLERRFPDRRLFVTSDNHTRFISLKPQTQFIAWAGSSVFLGWGVVATTILLIDSIGAGNFRAQAERDKMIYEDRLNALSAERDFRAEEAVAAQDRFAAALEQVSAMQSELLTSEERRRELETGLEVVHDSLRRTMIDREEVRERVAALQASEESRATVDPEELTGTLDLMVAALAETAAERDRFTLEAEEATQLAGDFELEMQLMTERNDKIFGQLEDALTISVEPLDEMFRTAGLDPNALIDEVQAGYSDGGGALEQIQFSTMGAPAQDDSTLRANQILNQLDRINLYRTAVDRVPLSMPVKDAFRYTSPFGPRWGRMHEGVDMAGPVGTPIYATADGVVTFAGWQSGYGRIIKVQHEFGIETRYPHLNAIRVEVGQRVSRGERIGDMGNSGRSTGSHLHYEIRVNGEALDPMIYIRAGQEAL